MHSNIISWISDWDAATTFTAVCKKAQLGAQFKKQMGQEFCDEVDKACLRQEVKDRIPVEAVKEYWRGAGKRCRNQTKYKFKFKFKPPPSALSVEASIKA